MGTIVERELLPGSVAAATRAAERVHLITATVAMEGTMLDAAVSAGARQTTGVTTAAMSRY